MVQQGEGSRLSANGLAVAKRGFRSRHGAGGAACGTSTNEAHCWLVADSASGQGEWPQWWHWDLVLSPHGVKRMSDRGFGEADLRLMLASAHSCRRDRVAGRWIIEAEHYGSSWHVIVEPEQGRKLLVFVTAYPAES